MTQYTGRNYVSMLVLAFFGVTLFAHGFLGLWSLHSIHSLFVFDTLLDSLGCASEIIVGSFLVLLGFFTDEVVEFFEWALDSLYID